MKANVECEVCGGTDFYKESGHYYCNECQTQTQELKEHVFQEEIAVVNVRTTRKIHKEATDKTTTKLTSWEYYNVVMASLTDQLINLGADQDLKSIVRCLWMKYLEKLEVINPKSNEPPKLQLINSKRDAQILFGAKKRKRKKSPSSQSSYTSHDTSSVNRERSRKKRALAAAHYDDFSQMSTQSSSHQNLTLSSLKSSSDKTTEKPKVIKYNVHSNRFLKNQKRFSVKHVKKHKNDIHHELTCHKFTHKNVKRKFVRDVHNITPTKLYCILYLGLLINKDKIQLSDLLRFIREGHVSFNNFHQLFSEECDYSALPADANCTLLCSMTIRKTTAALAKFLDVCSYVDVPDIFQLSKRFCKELNLPDEIHTHICNLISKSTPNFNFTKNLSLIPNYEGRIVSFVLFTLKLLFGLDDKTEFELSNYSEALNKLKVSKTKMFDIKNWLEYISYRDFIVGEYHFPTSFLKDPDNIDSDSFVEYFMQHVNIDENRKLSKQLKDYKEVLTLIDDDHDVVPSVTYSPSFTPFLDYAKSILDAGKNVPCSDVLLRNFKDDGLEFLLKPNKYLRVLDNRRVKNSGARDDIEFVEIENKDYARTDARRKGNKLIMVELIDRGEEKYIEENLNNQETSPKKIDTNLVLSNWHTGRAEIFERNKRILKQLSKSVHIVKTQSSHSLQYKTHYNPDERYWMMLEQFSLSSFVKDDVKNLVEKYPHNFKIALRECLRMIEQSEEELIYELQNTELYFAYVHKYEKDKSSNSATDLRLANMVKKCKKDW